MRSVIQRVAEASVSVGGVEKGKIAKGLLIYLGIQRDDDDRDTVYMAEKIANLRIFEDDQGAMNLSVIDIKGEALVISQFTLLGDCRRGRRPSFTEAMEPQKAEILYNKFIQELINREIPTKQGVFRAMMKIYSINDGPVTILLDSKKVF